MLSLRQNTPSLLNGHGTSLPQLPDLPQLPTLLPQVNSPEILPAASDSLSWTTSEFFINVLFVTPIYSLLLAGVLTFMTLRHPLAIGVTLLVCTLVVSALTAYVFPTAWFGFSLFLIIVGGLIVIFVYVSLLSSNETFGILGGTLVLITTIAAIVAGIIIGIAFDPRTIGDTIGRGIREGARVPTEVPGLPTQSPPAPQLPAPQVPAPQIPDPQAQQCVAELFSRELGILTLFLVSYLLLSLLVVVFNTKASRSTLRTQK